MFALGVSFLYGLAIAAAIGVSFTMIAALTLLPALLGFIGPRVLSRKQKKDLAANGPRIVGSRHQGLLADGGPTSSGGGPIVPAVVALIIVVLIAMPFFSPPTRHLRPGQRPDGHDHPPGLQPAVRRVRAGLQRSAAAGGRADRARSTPRPSTRWPPRCATPARRGRRGRRPIVLPAQRRRAGGADQRLPDDVAAGRRPPPT